MSWRDTRFQDLLWELGIRHEVKQGLRNPDHDGAVKIEWLLDQPPDKTPPVICVFQRSSNWNKPTVGAGGPITT
jgi:hypothetical protein